MAVPFVGLTGGLGAGKSTALATLARLGASVLSTDAVVHDLYAHDASLREALREKLGDDVIRDGEVDRAAVAQRVFSRPELRYWLEQLIWPLVGVRVGDARAAADAADPPPVAMVVETPLLFEAGMDAMYDATIAVVAEDHLREERTAERGHAAMAEREARQMPQGEKAARATYTVSNDGTVAELERKLSDVLATLSR